MGLLISDMLLLAPLLDEALRLLDGLSELAYALDATCDDDEHESADPNGWPRLTFPTAALATDADQ